MRPVLEALFQSELPVPQRRRRGQGLLKKRELNQMNSCRRPIVARNIFPDNTICVQQVCLFLNSTGRQEHWYRTILQNPGLHSLTFFFFFTFSANIFKIRSTISVRSYCAAKVRERSTSTPLGSTLWHKHYFLHWKWTMALDIYLMLGNSPIWRKILGTLGCLPLVWILIKEK